MTATNCTLEDEFSDNDKVLPALSILVFVVLIINSLRTRCLVRNWKKHRIINVFVINLGLENLLYMLSQPFIIHYYLKGYRWKLGESFCKVSVYRYLSIIHPMKVMGKITATHSVVISGLEWILASVGSLPDVIYPKLQINGTRKLCLAATLHGKIAEYRIYSLSWIIFGFCIPFVVIAGCYAHVTLVICRSNMMKKDMKGRILKLLVVLILLFSLCYTPYHVFKNLSLYAKSLYYEGNCPQWYHGVFLAHIVSRGLVSLNSALNPLVNMCFNEDTSAQFRQLLQRCGQMCSCFKLKSSSQPVPHTEEETESAL